MNEDYVSYELAVKLKECGFDEPCDHYYNGHGNLNRYADTDRINRNTNGHHTPSCSAPTLAHAQKWLREKWDWHIDVSPAADCSLDADGQVCEEWNYWAFDIMHVISTRRIVESMEQYGSYEEALSAGISAAQELIKKGK